MTLPHGTTTDRVRQFNPERVFEVPLFRISTSTKRLYQVPHKPMNTLTPLPKTIIYTLQATQVITPHPTQTGPETTTRHQQCHGTLTARGSRSDRALG